MNLEQTLKSHIREVPNFPVEGVLFKDISPLFLQPHLLRQMREALSSPWQDRQINKVIGIDSRGFLLGVQIAETLNAGFVMARKKGKLPPETFSVSYSLEYGEAELESTVHSIQEGDRVIIHDDLLATGGTAAAAAHLVKKFGAELVGFSFIIDLAFLEGSKQLQQITPTIHSLITYES